MSEALTPVPDAVRRSDGEVARDKLLLTALKLFAEQGFANTSTRQIAAEAGANVAAIAYYFGDKAGLYRSAFNAAAGSPHDDIAHFAPVHLSLEQALAALYERFLAPHKMGDVVRHCMRLHFREMVEPTGIWQEQIENGIVPYQLALHQVLARHLGLPADDLRVHRLAVSIVAQGVFSSMGKDVLAITSPHLFANHAAIDDMAAHFTRCALAMVQAEKTRINPPAVETHTLPTPTP